MRDAGRRSASLTHLLVPAVPARRRCEPRFSDAKRVIVLEKSLAVGLGGIVSDGVRKALSGIVLSGLHGHRRPRGTRDHAGIAAQAVRRGAERGELLSLEFLDLNRDIVEREIAHGSAGAAARVRPREAILRDLRNVASHIA